MANKFSIALYPEDREILKNWPQIISQWGFSLQPKPFLFITSSAYLSCCCRWNLLNLQSLLRKLTETLKRAWSEISPMALFGSEFKSDAVIRKLRVFKSKGDRKRSSLRKLYYALLFMFANDSGILKNVYFLHPVFYSVFLSCN